MMRFSSKLKKLLLAGMLILLSCDISMLFAAPLSQQEAAKTDPQLRQLQTQVQAQINALNNSMPTKNTDNSSGAMNSSLANGAASQKNIGQAASANSAMSSNNSQPNNLLPPSPFNNAQSPQIPSQFTSNDVPATPPSAFSPAGSANGQTFQPSGTNSGLIPPPQQQAMTGGAAGPSSQTSANEPPIATSDLNDAAFSSMVQSTLPMSPDQIQKLRSVYMASQFAATSTPGTQPRPTASSLFVDLSPGATPPAIRLAQGFVTSLVFVDSTGAPWPIESYDVGNPSAFNIQWDKTGNTLMVQSTVLYTYGNMAIKLKGLNTPVMLTLVPGQKAIDYRVDMRVQGFGPNAQPFTANTLPDATSTDLLNVLDGVPPANSQVLKVEGGDCQVWKTNSTMYVRTRLTVLSPGWKSTLSSADGMHAYEMQPAPMLLVSQNGEVVQLKVEGF